MKRMLAVFHREFAGYFLTPIGYVVVGMFAAISGIAFTLSLVGYAKMSVAPTDYGYTTTPDLGETLLSPYLVFCGMLFMFLSPLITMKMVAEEKNRGTMELLLTWPLRDRDIIFGKYLAGLAMLLVMIAVIGIHLGLLGAVASVEPAVLVFGLLAVFLMGAAFVSLGLFVSSVTRNQITSGVVTFGISLLFYVAGNLGEEMPAGNPAPEAWPELLRNLLGYLYALIRGLIIELPVDTHAGQMALGVVYPSDIGYYVLFSAFFLFLTFRVFESRNWRT